MTDTFGISASRAEAYFEEIKKLKRFDSRQLGVTLQIDYLHPEHLSDQSDAYNVIVNGFSNFQELHHIETFLAHFMNLYFDPEQQKRILTDNLASVQSDTHARADAVNTQEFEYESDSDDNSFFDEDSDDEEEDEDGDEEGRDQNKPSTTKPGESLAPDALIPSTKQSEAELVRLQPHVLRASKKKKLILYYRICMMLIPLCLFRVFKRT